MPWIQISITSDQAKAADVEQRLITLGAISVTLLDAEDQPILEPAPGETPMWNRSIITGTFDDSANADEIARQLSSGLRLSQNEIQIESLPDQDWTRAWMADYHAMQFGERLWVCPLHLEPPQPSAVNLRLDPGLAFGTGTHPTTGLCLRWLDANMHQPQRLLDYGCGSGILAIAALLLGATHADAVDIDEQALLATKQNASVNRVDSRLSLYSVKDFEKTAAPPAEYDVVMANILSCPLVQLAPKLAAYTRPGGDIVLSGILRDQVSAVMQAYAAYFTMDAPQYEADWVLLHGCKKT
jgi:ribosomal protein L11 methyltransferase